MSHEINVCGSCGEPIYWLKHARTHRPAPIEVKVSENGNILANPDLGTYCIALPAERITYQKHLHLNHFATCPQARTWAKAGRA